MPFPCFVVDAFTDTMFGGNPAAVVLLNEDRDSSWMQSVAAEMNLSETAFVDVRAKANDPSRPLRWFTPHAEVALCGHATLAAAHALGNSVTFVTQSGELHCSVDNGWVEMGFPSDPPVLIESSGVLRDAFGESQVTQYARGQFDTLVELSTEQNVIEFQPDFRAIASVGGRGVIITARSDKAHSDFVSRCFYPNVGVPEDPVTGSAHCTLANWWSEQLQKTELVGYQASTRGGIVRLSLRGHRVHMFGQAITVTQGQLNA